MLLLPRLTSRSSRSLAAMLACGQASRGPGDWPAGIPERDGRYFVGPRALRIAPSAAPSRFNPTVR